MCTTLMMHKYKNHFPNPSNSYLYLHPVMNIEKLSTLYTGHPNFASVIQMIENNDGAHVQLKGLAGASLAIMISNLFQNLNSSFFLILNDREEAAYYFDDLRLINGKNNPVVFLPSSYKPSRSRGKVDHDNLLLRTEVLKKIADKEKVLIITYPEALVEKVVSNETLLSNTLSLSVNDKLSIEFVTEVLIEYGFNRVEFVFEPGQFSIRGGIVDVFSYSGDEPYRIDFFGNQVETIRTFDADTQLSLKPIDTVSIIPDIQHGLSDEKRIPLFEYLAQNTLLVLTDTDIIFSKVDQTYELLAYQATPFDYDEENPAPNINWLCQSEGLASLMENFKQIHIGPKKPSHCTFYQFSTLPQPVFNKNFELLANDLRINQSNGYTNFILSNNEQQINRLQSIFDDKNLNVKITPLPFTFHEGFIDKDLKMAFYTDHQIFERYHRYSLQDRRKQARESLSIKELNKLHPGDYVVHIDHGIGRFAGLVKIEVNGKIQEAIRLVYRDNDSLLVSIHSLHRISKYKGKDGTEPSLNKLGTAAWQKIKQKAKSRVKDIAKELIALYAQRLQEQGYAFSADTYMQQELEASFLYEDTPDQYKATVDVKADMEKLMPMDRLVCGDVGFGKTEVAVRAAFKAASDSKQVAVLVPTTILALQHYKTFSERLKEFPVKVDYLSRLRSAADLKKTKEELKLGKIDIVIGTHKLVGQEIKFKDLGLLIIDEEQKFGVSVKEKLKQLKVNVDTLTLTATPIPRTLQFSLMGARDLSIMQTPPPNRYPIVTEVHGFNEAIIREAILYEVDRGGQVFFIHNRVQNIHEVENLIRKACPGVRTIVGHGQMEGAKLEKTMLDFIEGKYDVLIATTIIESGLDIPNANTIIINHAQNFGLSDLHQLRGRVGRSNKKAFCYLLSPPLSTLTPEARRRLKAIDEYSDLGSGFNIAMQDLDIRGAGNMLGAEQSGFIADIGFETYHRILNEAVHELKQEEFSAVFEKHDREEAAKAFLQLKFTNDCVVETDLELRFPESYISSISERMALYRELDNLEEETELQLFENNVADRFGEIPKQALNLFEVVRLRRAAIKLGIERIILKENKMRCHFISDQKSPFYHSPVFSAVLNWLQLHPGQARMKESKERLSLIFDKVNDIGHGRRNLEGITLPVHE